MNITKQQVDDLNAVVKIELQPDDYQERVSQVIRQYQKTASVPGFRPGKVPTGIIKKMYGKAVLVDELNKLLSESLGKYIYDNKLEVIGTPLPKKSEKDQAFEEGKDFEFLYELGIAPHVEVTMPKNKVPYYLVKVDEKMVEDDVADIRRRYGKFSNPEVSDETNILYGEFNELDSEGILIEGGHKTTTSVSIEMVKDVQDRKQLVGLKKGDVIRISPRKLFVSEEELTALLKLEKGSPSLDSDYQFTVMTVNQIEKAELNQELFDKVYNDGSVKTEEEFYTKIREGIASYFERESDRKLKKDLKTIFLEELTIPLPDSFLKRMLKANQEKEMDEHTFEHEYFHVAEDLRWNLIQGKLSAMHSIEVTEDEIKELSRQIIRQQFAQYGYYEMEPDRLEDIATRYLNEEGNYDKLDRSIRENKVFEILKKEVKLDMIEMPYADFIGKLNEKTTHEAEHHHA
ncbi:MAG: trigger factor [Bacteroidia bacterium]|nr:trigger factor [Bacteroidia bacterium]